MKDNALCQSGAKIFNKNVPLCNGEKKKKKNPSGVTTERKFLRIIFSSVIFYCFFLLCCNESESGKEERLPCETWELFT